MDQIKIGKFIASMRKKQGLSQKQLAERIDVTDKTVSKWETGYRMPDASILLKLSCVLQIDVNELLAGEEFPPEEYVSRSESTLVNLVGELNETGSKGKSQKIGTAIGILFLGMSFSSLLAVSLRMGSVADIFDLPTLLYLLGAKFFVLSVTGWFRDYVNAWKACFLRSRLPEKETVAAMQAMKYAGALSLALGCLISSVGLFSMLHYMDGLHAIGPALSQIALAFFYTSIQETASIVLYFKIKKMSNRGPDAE